MRVLFWHEELRSISLGINYSTCWYLKSYLTANGPQPCPRGTTARCTLELYLKYSETDRFLWHEWILQSMQFILIWLTNLSNMCKHRYHIAFWELILTVLTAGFRLCRHSQGVVTKGQCDKLMTVWHLFCSFVHTNEQQRVKLHFMYILRLGGAGEMIPSPF